MLPRHTDNACPFVSVSVCNRIGIACWNPNQIRHTRATDLSEKYGAMAEAASL